MRIALIGDSHGYVPALEAALAACRAAAPDLIVFCGDLVTGPFSPDPPGESIALLRARDLRVLHGNHDLVLRAHGTAEWPRALALRLERGDAPGPWINLIPAGQAEMAPADLAWLRGLPADLVVDAARPGDVYACHAIPGNPFLSADGSDRRETVEPARRERAFAQPQPAAADLILCGHSHVPATIDRQTPNGHPQRIVRTGAACGWGRRDPRAPFWQAGYTILTLGPGTGASAWTIERGLAPFTPRDPDWTWEQSMLDRGGAPSAPTGDSSG